MDSVIKSAMLAFGVALVLSGCSLSTRSAPKNLNDACQIIKQRPDIKRAAKKAEKKWGVAINVQFAILRQESAFKADARPPQQYWARVIPAGHVSTAYGYSQALDGTWDNYRKSTGNRHAKRDNIGDALDFIGWYFHQSRKQLGIPLNDAKRQYLAYHEGQGGYRSKSYLKKPWLIDVANLTQSRSKSYGKQLRRCL